MPAVILKPTMVKEELYICEDFSKDKVITVSSYEEIGNYIKEGKADAGIGIIEEVGIGVSDELHNLLVEKDLYITHCKVQEDGGVRRKVVTFTDKLVDQCTNLFRINIGIHFYKELIIPTIIFPEWP